jgi:hypothetical protein
LHLALCLLLACPAKPRWPMVNVLTDHMMASGIPLIVSVLLQPATCLFPLHSPHSLPVWDIILFVSAKATSHSMGLYAWNVGSMNSNYIYYPINIFLSHLLSEYIFDKYFYTLFWSWLIFLWWRTKHILQVYRCLEST